MKRRYHVGLPFWLYCGLTVMVAAGAMHSGNNLLCWVFGVMASGLLVSGIFSGSMMLGLRVRRIVPAYGVAGEPMTVRYGLRNRGRLIPAFNIHFRELPVDGPLDWRLMMNDATAWVMHVGPRELIHGEATYWPQRRGAAQFGEFRIASTFPFGIVGKSLARIQPQRVLVFPRVYRVRERLLDAITPTGVVGSRITSHAGAGDDYYGLREYRPGDSMRHISWKRTASRDELVCIERTRSSPPRLRIVVNLTKSTDELEAAGTDIESARGLEEDAISLAASIVDAADAGGFEIGLTVLGLRRRPIPARYGRFHRDKIMAEFAELDLDAPRQSDAVLGYTDEARTGLVVLHPDRIDVSVVRGEAWHFSAKQMDHIVDLRNVAHSKRESETARRAAQARQPDEAVEAAS
jgi:uncharacterized protein (DUF58 family)